MTVDIPESVTDDAAQTLEDAVNRLQGLTIEDREYALHRSDLPDDVGVQEDRDGLPYTVDGKTSMFSEIVVAVDGDDARIAAEWNSRRGHWKERDYAGEAYDVMERAGIPRPNRENLGEPRCYTVGVQFGSEGSVAVENIRTDCVEESA
jgi:hypothetical protein